MRFLAIPFVAALLACILFFLVALIPQSAIQENASLAAQQLLAQPQHPSVLNTGEHQYVMDNYTDSQIIQQSYNLTISDPASILSNPKHVSESDTDNMAIALDEVVNQGAENEIHYVRYWMGFRILVRPLLLLGSYFDIRRIVAFVFFALLTVTVITISRKVDTKTTLCFGLALAMMNPAIISQSLQFSCLFLLSFLFVICICHLRDRVPLAYLFCAFGVLTQLFDFYTVPILSFGLPMLVYLMGDPAEEKPFATILKSLLAWGFGYVFMWLLKLALVTVFTDINGFADGLYRFAQRTGIVVMEEASDKYDVIGALKAVWATVFPGGWGKPAFFAIALILLCSAFVTWRKGGWQALLQKSHFLMIAAIPVIWFICSPQPTFIHAWFQYRSLTVSFFALGLFVLTMPKVAAEVSSNEGDQTTTAE